MIKRERLVNSGMKLKREDLVKGFLFAFGLVTLLVIWHGFGELNRVIPTPGESFEAFVRLSLMGDDFGTSLRDHGLSSFFRVFAGVAVAAMISIPLGVLMAWNRSIYHFFLPLVESLRSIPPIAWIPVALILFGLSLEAYAIIIFTGAFFPLLTSTITGVRRTDPVHVETFRSIGATDFEVVKYVVLPSALPEIYSGIKISTGIGWMCVMAAELLGQAGRPRGLGFLIDYSRQLGHWDEAFAALVALALIGLVIALIFDIIDYQLFKWRETSNGK